MPRTAPTTRDRIHAALAALLIAAGHTGSASAAPGEPLLSYGDGGVLFVDSGNDHADRIRGVLGAADGSAWATGVLNLGINTGGDLALIRLLANGDLDPSFGDGGIAGLDTGGHSDLGMAVIRQPDGKLLVAGRLHAGAYTDWGLVRFNANGTLDTGFGEADGQGARRGYVRINVAPDTATNDQAVDLALQSDGRIVVAGHGYAFDGSFKYVRFALARFTTDGTLDTTFGDQGRVISPSPLFQRSEYPTAIAKRADGRLPANDSITVVGYVFAGSEAQIRRYLADGSPDTSFNGNGIVRITDSCCTGARTGIGRFEAAVLQEDGRLVVAGTGIDRGFAFLRVNLNGTVDSSFGNNGRQYVKFSDTVDHDEPASLVLLPDGRLAAAGFATATNDGIKSEDFAIVQLLPNGQPDPEFGDGNGRARYPLSLRDDGALALTAMPHGGLLAAGSAVDDTHTANTRAAFLRLSGTDRIFRDGFE